MSETLPTENERQAHFWRWLMAALVFVFIRAIPNISYPIGRDQATYAVIGRGFLNGQQLYRDIWDNKPPGIYALFALLVKVFGQVMWSVGLVDILWMIIISVCIFEFTRRYLGTAAAAIAVVINSVWHANLGFVDAAQPECLLMVAVFLAFFLVSSEKSWPRARNFAAGLLMGAAFWLKYNALAFFPLVAIVPYLDFSRLDLRPRRIGWRIPWYSWFRRMGALGAGFLLTIAGVLAYYWRAGAWSAFVEAELRILPRYAAMPVERTPHYWAIPIAITFLRLGVWTIMATGASVLIAEKRDLSRLCPILAAAAMGYAMAASQLHFPPYAFETSFPFFAMIWGYLATTTYEAIRSARQSPSRRSRIWAAVAAAGVVAVTVFYPLRLEAQTIGQRYRDLALWWRNPGGFYANYPGMQFKFEHLSGELQVVRELKKTLAPGETVFIWGTAPLIYFLTDRQPPNRFVNNHGLIAPWGPPAWRKELMINLQKSPPEFIVVSQDDQIPEIMFTNLDSEHYLAVYTDLGDFISGSYTRAQEFPGFVLYRRKTREAIR
jgi:hypothetical protein